MMGEVELVASGSEAQQHRSISLLGNLGFPGVDFPNGNHLRPGSNIHPQKTELRRGWRWRGRAAYQYPNDDRDGGDEGYRSHRQTSGSEAFANPFPNALIALSLDLGFDPGLQFVR